MSPLREFSGELTGISVDSKDYAAELIVSQTVNRPFGEDAADLVIHAALARLAGNSNRSRPSGATIGISSFTFLDTSGNLKTVNNGPPEKWPTFAYLKAVTSFTISLAFYRCETKGSFFVQQWG